MPHMKGKQRDTHLDFIHMPCLLRTSMAWFMRAAAAMASSRNPGCLSGYTCEIGHFGLLSVTFKIARASASHMCPSFAMGTASTKLINSGSSGGGAVAVVAVVAVVTVVAVVVWLVAAVVLAAVARAHDHLGRLGHPCPMQAPAKGPFGPLPGGALRTHSERSPTQHPPEPPQLSAWALPSASQPAQLLATSLPPASLPTQNRCAPLPP